jgi:hypothetical protein
MDRRAFVARLAAVAAVAVTTDSLPARAAVTGLAAVKIDTAPLVARGLPNYAKRIDAIALPAARAALAPHLTGGKGAPTLVLSLAMVDLAADPSGGHGRHGGGGGDKPSDVIDGEALLVDARGKVLARTRIYTSNPAASIESISTPAGEDRRIARLVDLFARWAQTELKP